MTSNILISESIRTNMNTQKVIESLPPGSRTKQALHTKYKTCESPNSLYYQSSGPYRSGPVTRALQSVIDNPHPVHNSLGLTLNPSPAVSRLKPKSTPKFKPTPTPKVLEISKRNRAHSPFLRLPPEIRKRIYDLLCPHQYIMILHKRYDQQPFKEAPLGVTSGRLGFCHDGDIPALGLWRSSRQLYNEMFTIFYRSITFAFRGAGVAEDFFRKINIVTRRAIKSICICHLVNVYKILIATLKLMNGVEEEIIICGLEEREHRLRGTDEAEERVQKAFGKKRDVRFVYKPSDVDILKGYMRHSNNESIWSWWFGYAGR